MKKRIVCILATILTISVSGFTVCAEAEQDDPLKQNSRITGKDEYDEIIRKYIRGLNGGWSMQEFAENGLCYLAGYASGVSSLGYYVADLDGNGTEELLIGETDTDGYGNGGFFYDLYTVNNGEIILIASSMERDRYSLCEENIIANDGSGSAFTSTSAFYYVDGSELEFIESIKYDAYYDEEYPWFYSNSDPTNDYSMPVSAEYAEAVQKKYEYKEIPFIPMSDILDTGEETVAGKSEYTDDLSSGHDIINTVCEIKRLPYIGNDTFALSAEWSAEGYMQMDSIDTSGVIGAVMTDFDQDGMDEIFSVTYECSEVMENGKNSIRFSMFKIIGDSWQLIAQKELLSTDWNGDFIDISSMSNNHASVYEGSVFLRKYNGEYQFFFEKYECGIHANGVSWELRGYRFDGNRFVLMGETENLQYEGSDSDVLSRMSEDEWNSYYEDYEYYIVNDYHALGFEAKSITYNNMTAAQNSTAYPVVSLRSGNDLSSEQIDRWFLNPQYPLEGFWYSVEDCSKDVPANLADAFSRENKEEQGNEEEHIIEAYIIEDSDSRYLNENDIAFFSTDEIQRAINEIYARHGRVFSFPENDAYFRSQSWYHPDENKTDEQILAEFNACERYNVEFLSQYL